MVAAKKTAKSKPSKSTPKTAAIWKSSRDAKLPDRGDNGTYSLRLLLDFYSPGVLVTAVEKHGIHTCDRYGREIHCTKADITEQLERALALLADWQAELDDPGPEYSWDSEKYYGGDHPTESWWLPDKVVKRLNEIRDSPVAFKETIEERRARLGWKGVLQEEATKLVLDAERNGDPNWTKISVNLEEWAVENELKTDKGNDPSWGYIKSHVISLKDWLDPIRQKYKNRPNHR